MNNTVLQDGQFSITKEQLRQLTDPKIKEWFPEVFNLSKDFTGWVKAKGELNKKWITFFENGFQKYGIDSDGNWFAQNIKVSIHGDEFEATEQEVFEALKNEAVKRGFVEGALCNWGSDCGVIEVKDLRFEAGKLWCDKNWIIMDEKGTWATIIQTITKSEAEKLLNKKIID